MASSGKIYDVSMLHIFILLISSFQRFWWVDTVGFQPKEVGMDVLFIESRELQGQAAPLLYCESTLL